MTDENPCYNPPCERLTHCPLKYGSTACLRYNPLDNPGDNAYILTEIERIEEGILKLVHQVNALHDALNNLIRTFPEAERREQDQGPAFIKKSRRKGLH